MKVNAIGYYTLDVAMTFMNLGVVETVRENPAGSYEYCKTALEIYEVCLYLTLTLRKQ